MRASVVLVVFFLLFSSVVMAHPAKELELAYDQNEQVLSVKIEHTTRNMSDHYIRRLTITKNGEQVEAVTIPRQSRATGHDEWINMQAEDGDTIVVKSFCSKGGTKEATIIIGSLEKEPSETDSGTAEGE